MIRHIPVNSLLEKLVNATHPTTLKLPNTLRDTSQIKRPLIIQLQNFHNLNLNETMLDGTYRDNNISASVLSRQHIMPHNNQLATSIQTSIDINHVRKMVETITILSTNPLVVFEGQYVLYDSRNMTPEIPVNYSSEQLTKKYYQIFCEKYPFVIPGPIDCVIERVNKERERYKIFGDVIRSFGGL